MKVLLFRALAHSNAVPAVKGEVRGVGKFAICWKQDILLEEMKRLSLFLGFKYLKSHFHAAVISLNYRMFPVGSL